MWSKWFDEIWSDTAKDISISEQQSPNPPATTPTTTRLPANTIAGLQTDGVIDSSMLSKEGREGAQDAGNTVYKAVPIAYPHKNIPVGLASTTSRG